MDTYGSHLHEIALAALHRKYSPVFDIDRDPANFSDPEEVTEHLPNLGANDSAAGASSTLVQEPFKPNKGRANATFVMLARNSDLDGALSSIRQLEARFNSRFNYPYVFLNEEEFSDDFKTLVSASYLYLIPRLTVC